MSELRYVDLDGARLGYDYHPSAGKLGTLVFGHGYALRSTGALYAPLFAALSEDFEIYALDHRGHGASVEGFASWSQTELADDLAGFVDALGLKGAIFAGHSLGGFTGLFAEIRHPGTFSALCLLATAAAGGGTAPLGLDSFFAENRGNADALYGAFAPMFVRPRRTDVMVAVDAVALVPSSVHTAFYAGYPHNIITDRLAGIDVPVLVLNGAQDVVVPPDAQHLTALGLSSYKEVVLSREGHMLPLEAPLATAREIANFVRFDVAALQAPARFAEVA